MSNKYLHIYNALIHKRKCIEVLVKSHEHYGEYENHHIIPKACGGTNYKENIVCLTIREHYIAHLLLAKIYKNSKFEQKMLHAISLMKNGPTTSKRSTQVKCNSKLFALLVSKGRKMLRKTHSYKGYINITNGIENKLIPPSKLDEYLSNNWYRGQTQHMTNEGRKRKGNKYRNTYFVTNGIHNLRIQNDQPIPYGYHKGRVFNCQHLSNHPTMTNHIWIYKDNTEIHVSINDVESYLKLGYRRGRLKNDKIGFANRGRICINNGIKNKKILPDELSLWESNGWKHGMIK